MLSIGHGILQMDGHSKISLTHLYITCITYSEGHLHHNEHSRTIYLYT